jgi:hypothetical protein
MTIDELRRAIANPGRDFVAKTMVAGLWWFQQLLLKVGDRQSLKASRKDKKMAALLLCVAMDGQHGRNDDLAPMLAAMLRPYCPAPTFVDAWERANKMAPGTARAEAASIIDPKNAGARGESRSGDQAVSASPIAASPVATAG